MNLEELLTKCDALLEKETRKSLLKKYNITLSFLDTGMTMYIGNKMIAFSTIHEGMEAVVDYVTAPIEQMELWKKEFNNQEE